MKSEKDVKLIKRKFSKIIILFLFFVLCKENYLNISEWISSILNYLVLYSLINGFFFTELKDCCFVLLHYPTTLPIITQRVSMLRGTIDNKLVRNHEEYFNVQMVNCFNQLPVKNCLGENIHYSCYSHGYTLYHLRKLKRLGYIENLKYSEGENSSLYYQRKRLGLKSRTNIKMYNIKFDVSEKMTDITNSLVLINTLNLDEKKFKIVKSEKNYFIKIRYANIIRSYIKNLRVFDNNFFNKSKDKIKKIVK